MRDALALPDRGTASGRTPLRRWPGGRHHVLADGRAARRASSGWEPILKDRREDRAADRGRATCAAGGFLQTEAIEVVPGIGEKTTGPYGGFLAS